MPWGWGGGRRGWAGPWPGRGPFSYLPPWQRPGWLFGRGACWWLLGYPGWWYGWAYPRPPLPWMGYGYPYWRPPTYYQYPLPYAAPWYYPYWPYPWW
ncbi:MAG: hypothetical protein DRK00_09905 [Thermoprotei archaeon]|nr:MAG: hypothetical protein DRK00_09905 [Thermoprotei archaeon]